ncbi:MAG: hypothetical protein A2X93_01870 [Deltaproteobacteria bacterium GWC2_56_8]|nr:MAG: hypothetical protein A2X93_01870 [Deltaproteobacteria bacterium GWC2_56_8]
MQYINKYYVQLVLFFTSFVILLQSPCAPYANKVAEYDAGVFIYSAKQIINGGLIYKEIFDHKGPLLYLIDVVGLMIFNGNMTGIWLMELIFLFLAAILCFKTAHLFADKFVSLLATVYSLFVLAALEPGHGSQHYALPLIALSVYIFLKCYKEPSDLTKCQIVMISFSFTLVLLLQPNLVTIWISFGMITFFNLYIKRDYRRLFTTMSIAILSIFATLLPFVIYAFYNKIISDIISCYWLFNRAYSHPSFSSTLKGAYYALLNIEKGYAIIPLSFYIGHLMLHYKVICNRLVHIGILLSLFLTLFIGCGLSGRDYPHYSIVLLPLICVIAALDLEYLQDRCSVTNFKLIFILAIFSWKLALIQINATLHAFTPDERLNAQVEFIRNVTEATDKIAVVGNDSQLYFLSGRESSSRFHYTSPIFEVEGFKTGMIRQYQDDLRRNKPKLVAVKTADYPHPPAFMQNFLAENYHLLSYADNAVIFYLRNS